MQDIILFEKKENCCGCAACMNICPKGAIRMCKDEYGFEYPAIDQDLCVHCGLCVKTCVYQKDKVGNKPLRAYAAAIKSDKMLKKSASGGVFTALAKYYLENNGVAYGAALFYDGHKLIPKHTRIEHIEELSILQGSKYVQSEIGMTYQQVRTDLRAGKKVLFSGTPCQVAGLRGFLGKNQENLLAVDIICHGVPSAQFFQDYVDFLEKRKKLKVINFAFRDKSRGQGMMARVDCDNGNRVFLNGKTTSYYSLFLKSLTYRKNCYSCPYACAERAGDITLGDFWEFHKEYPDYNEKKGLTNQKGISCILINTPIGETAVNQIKSKLTLMDTDYATIARHNQQLHSPSTYHESREKIMQLYKEEGYSSVDHYYQRRYMVDIIKNTMISFVPKKTRRTIMRFLGKLR